MLTEFLEGDLKLCRGTSDTCLYHYHDANGWVLLATEVDDLVITGTHNPKIDEIKATAPMMTQHAVSHSTSQ